jgi:hypothetical protein
MNMQVSHEAIYQYIYVLPRGELKQLLIKGLMQERKHRRPQKRGDTAETRGKIENMLSIEERPAGGNIGGTEGVKVSADGSFPAMRHQIDLHKAGALSHLKI